MSFFRVLLSKLRPAVLALPLILVVQSLAAADMAGAPQPAATDPAAPSAAPAQPAAPAAPPGLAQAADPAAALDAYLRRQAVLLMIRASFDVVPHEEVPDELAAEARRLGANGPGAYDLARLDRDLLAEASYYLVSLRYLAALGGAIWPSDRPEQFYVNDVLVRLDALQDRLIEAVETRADPLPILIEAQAIHALTEGLSDVPEHLDYFGRRDPIVERVLAEDGPRTST